jgi:hypothetical protein
MPRGVGRPLFFGLPLRLSLRLVRTRRLTRELRRLACAPKESCSLRRRGGAVVVLFRNDAFGRGFPPISTKKELESEGEWDWGMVGGPARAGLIFGAKGMEVAHGGAPHDATPIGVGDPPGA